MVSEKIKRKTYEVKNIIKLYNEQTDSEVQRILSSHLLIIVYTMYEHSVKEIVKKQFEDKKASSTIKFIFNPTLDKPTWTPKVDDETMKENFPLLKEWLMFINAKQHDSMVTNRHLYAHTGVISGNQFTIEQIITAYIEIVYIIFFIDIFYTEGNFQDFIGLESFFCDFKEMYGQIKANIVVCDSIISNDHEIKQDKLDEFDSHIKCIKNFYERIREHQIPDFIISDLMIPDFFKLDQDYLDFFNEYVGNVESAHVFCYEPGITRKLSELEKELEKIEDICREMTDKES